ncbi:rare lipoprotein A [Tardiphaga sp. OK246]|jgi:hypothetical protein|uniref:septal ring lytic transglycosylase RlpA family protein n=1 Tax=Tardiphaga sp. OK246 TaxID=1855307 RepID=UPI000B6D2019|nr:septal ring lytic transglycosylase RlpA family protein [Tardiphaga sp. OK246]SNS23987.1 rare lipoprotein A [Tardiphaga sp. OK246]
MIRPFSACVLLCVFFRFTRISPELSRRVVSINVTMTKEAICIASQYGIGDGYHGPRAVSGERFNTYALTAAHRARRFSSYVTVRNKANSRSVQFRITGRGPFIKGLCIDQSRAAANAIGMWGRASPSSSHDSQLKSLRSVSLQATAPVLHRWRESSTPTG